MPILHLSNYFPNSSIYEKLFFHLDQVGVKQTVYSAVRSQRESNYTSSKLNALNVNIRKILKPHDRLFYRLKIRKIFKDIVQNIDLNDINIIHAHTLYSDGGTALKIKRNFGIPYLVVVRATDIYRYQKYRPDLRIWRNKILREANNILFLSPGHKEIFLDCLNEELKSKAQRKSLIVPNGIDFLFLERSGSSLENKDSNEKLKLLYVGRFLKKKNISRVIEAVTKLSEDIDISLTLIGDGEYKEKIINMINEEPYISYLGVIRDREKLRTIYREHDIFIMVSKIETFGLVYIEALSQGTPVIYTHGQGIHGFFKKNTITEPVKNYRDVDEIIYKIKKLRKRLDSNLKRKCIKEAQQFDWNKIAENYKKIYNDYL